MKVGSTLLLDDGKVRIRVIEQGSDFLLGEVVAGTRLSNNKGFNVPDVMLPALPPDAQGPARYGFRAGSGGGVDRPVFRPAAGGRGGGARADRRRGPPSC